jgi:hypothetical protein
MIKSLIKNINILNILLIAIIVFVVKYTFYPASEKRPALLSSIQNIKSDSIEEVDKKGSPFLSPSIDYQIISENNPFHPERIIPVEKKVETQPLPKPEFVLYGTLITDDLKIAYMDDKKASFSTTGRGKRQIPLKPGESLSGFTIKEINEDNVVMVRGEEKLMVYLYDTSKPRFVDSTDAKTPNSTVLQRQQTQPSIIQQTPAPVQINPVTPTPEVAAPKQPMTPEQARDAFMKLFQKRN